VRRVLRDDGTLWLNLGDSYCNSNGFARASPEYQREGRNNMPANDRKLDKLHEVGLKTKDLIGIPWMVAFALRADGWYLRQDIIWHKPNPMPESVQDRCTKAHEYIFLLSKSPKYYFDHEAIKEDSVDPESHKGMKLRSADKRVGDKYFATKVGNHAVGKIYAKKNKRSVWTVTTKPFKGAHFATFPLDLIEPCILAGCPEGGIVLDPFGGAGTTGLVANKHKRDAILIELNADYVDIINNRVNSPIQDKLL
jgi:DNA modification methylase